MPVKIKIIALLCLTGVSGVGFSQSTINRATPGLKLVIADALQSNMVIQQNKPFKVWGYAVAGKTVTIKAGWLANPVTTIADNSGKFIGLINVPAVKKGDYTKHTISINSGDEQVVLDNLMIGDVWFCSGQSNMQFAMRELEDGDKKIDSVNNPKIRLLLAKFSWHAAPTDTFPGKWLECNPKSVRDFSAIGYYFADEIQRRLDIPIGVIYSGIGGSVTQAYVAEDLMAADPVLKAKYLDPFYKTDVYIKKKTDAFTFGTTSQPYLIYNGMIYPFLNLSIKGILWYQGESNREQREEYVKLNYTLINSWRKGFAQDNLPFYYVQVAPHAYQKPDSTLNDYAFFREAQEQISKLSNTGMVTTMDVGDKDNIHPKNKKPVALRLAYTALHQTYNMLDVAYRGPHINYVAYAKRKATIYFEPGTTEGGLKTNDGKAPKYFFVAGADQVFHYAEAKIDGNAIVLTCKDVKHPIAVRYAFTNYPVTNLENGAGLPAVPFRTDNWTEPNPMATSSK